MSPRLAMSGTTATTTVAAAAAAEATISGSSGKCTDTQHESATITILKNDSHSSPTRSTTDDADIAAGIIHLVPDRNLRKDECTFKSTSNTAMHGGDANGQFLLPSRSRSISNDHQLTHRHQHVQYDNHNNANPNHNFNFNLPNSNDYPSQHQRSFSPPLPSPTSISPTHFVNASLNTTANVNFNANANANVNTDQTLVLGINISHLSRKSQFITCAMGVFSFSLLYGYLQELISVTLCNRQLGLFLAMMQFLGYTVWSKIFHSFVQYKQNKGHTKLIHPDLDTKKEDHVHHHNGQNHNTHTVPFRLYLLLSILRAIDAGMTNMAMAYVNYPAKTLMKSSRVVFTMLFGTIIRRKRYKPIDYIVVTFMVSGLVIFMHADSKSSVVFQPIGIVMLTISLLCDGAINNMSEGIMTQYHIGQDEFIYNLYSIAVCGIIAAAAVRGDFTEGLQYIITPGTLEEIQNNTNIDERSWSVLSKCMILFLFSSTGFFGSSCSALITKEFGALTMSITSTARKAMTLFLSFALFHNVCTMEHIGGIFLFVTALVVKSFRVSQNSSGSLGSHGGKGHHDEKEEDYDDELEINNATSGSIAASSQYYNEDFNFDLMGEELKKESSVKRRVRRKKQQVIANIV